MSNNSCTCLKIKWDYNLLTNLNDQVCWPYSDPRLMCYQSPTLLCTEKKTSLETSATTSAVAIWGPTHSSLTLNSSRAGAANMLLLAALLVATEWSYGFEWGIPIQSPISITKSQGSMRLQCHFRDFLENFHNTVIHWYQLKENNPPKRLLFFAGGKTTVESGFAGNKYMVDNVSSRNLSILTINDVSPDDAATYYCAYWDPHHERFSETFGTGTKLIVSDKVNSPPENFEILQEEHERQVVYVCLIEKFYPEVIRVKWTDEANKEVTQNVVKGDVWKSPDEDKYSVSSWLSVSLESKNKKYFCNYEHESGEHSLPTQAFSESSPWEQEDCGTLSGNSTVFNRDHLTHKAAQLVYVVLLLKSSMYYVIVLFFFFTYRTKSAAKPSGKKT
ncbi:TCR gamma alternate reading frame protein [Coturnix japonica]|uniref:TCR gamma alternate reading frame protein n=1 Tax=Coturnix japonica TaxID=93934 RepID=UPI0013A5C97C|nr:TCR gamma alternate reading frame protein [Coturnix japonica]